MPKVSTNIGDLIKSLDSLAIQDEDNKQLLANFLGFDLLPLQNKHSEKIGTTTKRKDLNEIDITPPPSEDKEKKPPQNTSTTNIPRKDLNEKTPTNSTPSITHQTIPSNLKLIEERTKNTSLTFFIDGKSIEPKPLELGKENFGIENLNILHLQSLFDPDSINDTIAWSVANYKSSSQIDIDLLVEKISKRENFNILPTLKILSVPHTLQLLVDISDVMIPYKQDQDIVIEKVKQILGKDSVEVIRFKKYPHFSDVYFESEHKHKPYIFPDAKTTILLLTDLGIGQSSLSSPTNNEWESFACLAKEIECPLVAYVPFQENLWPKTLKDKIKIIYWDRNNPKHPIYERKSKNKINQKLEQKNNDKSLKTKLTLEEQLLELLTEKNPFLVELAKTLSLAAKIEPALLRYFRFSLFPNLEAGIETKLWSSELVQSGSDSEIIFFPKVAQLLRNKLAENLTYLDICWNKLNYFRKQYNSPYLLRLEELINYLSLKKSNFNDLKQLFFRIIKTITENSKHSRDVSRWAFSIIPKLDKQIAKDLPIEELLYSISLNLHIPITKKINNIDLDKFRSILPSNLAKINLGINLTPEGIEFGLAHNYNHYIEVSKTNPIILNIKNEKEEKKSIELFIFNNNLTPNFHKIYGNRFHIETIDGKIYELNSLKLEERIKYITLYKTTCQEIKTKDMDTFEQLSLKMSQLKELEEKIGNLLNLTEFAEWKRENNRFIPLLHKDYFDWNSWKSANKNEVIDLSYQDLSKYKLNLTHFNFEGVNFQGANLTGLDLTDTNLNNANLSKAILINARLNSANLINANLTKAQLAGNNILYGDFSSADFSEANLSNITLKKITLDKVNFTNANLSNAKLIETALLETNFTGSYWSNTKLSDVDLNNSIGLDEIKHETLSTLVFSKPQDISFLPTTFLSHCRVINKTSVVFIDIDAKIDFLSGLVNLSNQAQDYYDFQIYSISIPDKSYIKTNFGGQETLPQTFLPLLEKQLSDLPTTLGVDFVCCLTANMIAFEEQGSLHFNFFCADINKDCFAISTYKLSEHAKRANTNLPKAILFLISGMLVAMESKWAIDYHNEIVGCLFDKCIEHPSIVEGLRKMKFEHEECRRKVQNPFQLDTIDKLLALDLSLLINKKHNDEQHIKQLIKKASELHQTANFEEAIKLYDEAITLSESYLNSKDIFFIEVLAVSVMNKGLVLSDLGNPEEALTLMNKAIKYYEQNSQLNNQKVRAIINKASILTELSRHSESILSCDEGINIIKSTIKTYNLEEIELLAELLNNKGQSLHRLNRLSEALSCYNEGISLCESFNEDISIKLYNVLASLLLNKAVIFNRIDNNIEAEQLQDKAVFYYNELVNKEGEKWQPALAQALIGKAISLHNQNKFNEAINCYDLAFQLFINLIEKGRLQLKTNLAVVLHNKAGVFKSMSDFDRAILEYNKAIEIRQEIVKTQKRIDVSADLASSFLAKANLLKELNQLSESHDLYNKAEDIYSDLVENKHLSQFIPELAFASNNKANLLKELEETQQAISYHDKAISYYETLLQEQANQYLSKDLAKCFSDKAFTLWDINDEKQAIFYFDKAIEIYRSLIQVETPTTKLRKLFANALINKANILNQINSLDSIIYCDEAIQHYKILLEKNKEIAVIKAFIGAYNIKSNIAAKSGAFQKAIEYCDEIIRFATDLEQDIYKNIYQEMAMILSNKAFYLKVINSLSEALNTSDEATDLYNILLQDISNIKTKEHFILASNFAKTLSRKAEILHKLNRFEDSLNTYNQTTYWQKLCIQFCIQSDLKPLISNLLENICIDLYIRTITRINLNYLDDLITDIKDTFEMVKPFLLQESIEELNWKHYAKQLSELPITQRDQIYSKIRASSEELSLALGIIDPSPNPAIVGTIKEDLTVYYTQKDISREFWGDNKNARRLTNLIYEIVSDESYGILSLRKALRNVQEHFPDFWANEKVFFRPLTDNRPVFPAKISVHTNLPITNSSNRDILLSLNTQQQQIYLLDIPEDRERKLYCQISINPQLKQTQHLRVTANNKMTVPLEIILEINIFPNIANFQSCENAYTFLYAGQHFLNFLRKPINKLKFYFDVNDTNKIETHFTLDISKELEKLDFSHIDVEDVISNHKYIDNLVSQLDKIRIKQDLIKTNSSSATSETKETLEKELKEWQQEELIWLIKQGKDTWNNWRDRHPEQNIDLSNRQLKLDLEKSKTWLTSFNLSYANLQKCDLSSLELGQANLQGANLSNSILNYANIALTNFNKAILKNVQIESTLVIGVNFIEADFTGSNLTATNLRESKLDKANFSECNLTKTQIVNPTLSATNFTGSYWNGTKLIDSDLTKATGIDKVIHQGTSTLIFTAPIEISDLPTTLLQNCKIKFSSKTPKHWLLRTKPHITEINKIYEGREWQYEIVPYESISEGDIVHFWRNSEQDIYGWGEVIKNPGLPNNFSLQENQSVKLNVKIKAMSSDSIDKTTIRRYVPEIVELVKNASVGLGVIALSSLQVEKLNNLYRLHRMAPLLNSLAAVSRSSTSTQSNSTFQYETVKVDKKGKIVERTRKQANQIIDGLGNGVVLEMVEIPSGEFMMGTRSEDIEKVVAEYKRYASSEENIRRWVGYETPQHKVTVPTFYMGKYQVTQEQWKAIMGSNPSRFKGSGKLPVEGISWSNAVEFCKMLSEKTNKIYRLPSEVEWEYACRAGTETEFAFGETINTDIVNYDGNRPYGEGARGEYRGKTTVVGSLGVTNNFGLYDMHGNVWEWCQDAWHSNYNGAPTDGSVWDDKLSNNTYRVLRGGSYNVNPLNCRSADRHGSTPGYRTYDRGLRLVMATRTLK